MANTHAHLCRKCACVCSRTPAPPVLSSGEALVSLGDLSSWPGESGCGPLSCTGPSRGCGRPSSHGRHSGSRSPASSSFTPQLSLPPSRTRLPLLVGSLHAPVSSWASSHSPSLTDPPDGRLEGVGRAKGGGDSKRGSQESLLSLGHHRHPLLCVLFKWRPLFCLRNVFLLLPDAICGSCAWRKDAK